MKRMSNTYITGASMVALTFSLNIGMANAACEAMPTCADMGYTETSCATGVEVMKCPFDSTKVKCIRGCDPDLYKFNSCPERYVCTKCGGKYAYAGCAPGSVMMRYNDGQFYCIGWPNFCPDNYKVWNNETSLRCLYNGYCLPWDKCKYEDADIVKKRVYCQGEQYGWTRYFLADDHCHTTLKVGDRIYGNNISNYVTIIDIYEEEDSGIYAVAVPNVTQAETQSGMVKYGVYDNPDCWSSYSSVKEVLKYTRQTYSSGCQQSIIPQSTAMNVGGDYFDPLFNFHQSSQANWYLPTPYQLKKMGELGLLTFGHQYWAALQATPTDGVGKPMLRPFYATGTGDIQIMEGLDRSVSMYVVPVIRIKLDLEIPALG